MQKTVLAAATSAAMSMVGVAYAADLPPRYSPSIPPVPAFTWTSCYVGGFAGVAWANDATVFDRNNLAGQPGLPFDGWSYSTGSSFVGGGTAGCNLQPIGTPFVAGFEGEIGSLKLSGSGFDPLDPAGPNNILSSIKIGNWYGLVGGRLGYQPGE